MIKFSTPKALKALPISYFTFFEPYTCKWVAFSFGSKTNAHVKPEQQLLSAFTISINTKENSLGWLNTISYQSFNAVMDVAFLKIPLLKESALSANSFSLRLHEGTTLFGVVEPIADVLDVHALSQETFPQWLQVAELSVVFFASGLLAHKSLQPANSELITDNTSIGIVVFFILFLFIVLRFANINSGV